MLNFVYGQSNLGENNEMNGSLLAWNLDGSSSVLLDDLEET
jgi:hypothetical protein